MATWIWTLISLIVIITLLWAFYNFYWLNQSQIYLVYKTTSAGSGINVPYNDTDLSNFLSKFGAQWATVAQLNDPGASSGMGGWANEGTTGVPTNIYFPVWMNVPATYTCTGTAGCQYGCINSWGCNNQVNKAGQNSISSHGYWLYGPKPNASTVDGWSIAPWATTKTEGTLTFGNLKYNKFEILGIPKLG